ncbi:26S proteasome non-ATPase regulatory subunit [Sesamum angolense]|uniref:26S proteasome non-ATPase regulatory subunit 4 homolog n=1 Tax=Sesamum angolense TaxID=2727404 RepID=A0AAE1WIJ6_9LAMI|nr:26S proteasome non-ATPase regulatory subunit [Sesamum angolense]
MEEYVTLSFHFPAFSLLAEHIVGLTFLYVLYEGCDGKRRSCVLARYLHRTNCSSVQQLAQQGVMCRQALHIALLARLHIALQPGNMLPVCDWSCRLLERLKSMFKNYIEALKFSSLLPLCVIMVLEATMICIDNSEWMRNGDYSPNRFQAQADAVNLICGAKTQSNPENTVGVLTMAGKGVRVLVTPTSDLGKILACMHGLEIGGEMNLAAGIQVAQLALKHRQNKKQQQRIIVFAGSPVKYDKKVLELIGRKLKKNSVALDIVNFGEEDEERRRSLKLCLLHTPIFTGDGEGGSGFAAAAAAAAASGVSGFEFGVDPNLDPELALALRVSMEEERARQEAAAKKAAEEAAKQEKGEQQSTSQDTTMTENVDPGTSEPDKKTHDLMDDENALLQQALAMSMDDSSSTVAVRDTDMSDASADDHDLQLALQLSVQEGAVDQSNQTDMNKLADQSFVSSILTSLPGVDPNDPHVKDLLASMQTEQEDDKAPKEEGKEVNMSIIDVGYHAIKYLIP